VKRFLGLAIRILLVAIVVVYLIDWATLRIRMLHGGGYSTVQVDEYLSTPLKGNKDEYDYMGAAPEPCARAIFPHGAPPCWWLAKHNSRWE
jgi:hypothetical protein